MLHSHSYRIPSLPQSMAGASNKERLLTSFRLAERHLGIACLLDPDDVDVDKPDEKSIMTYLSQFLTKFPDPSQSALPKVSIF